MKQIKLKLIVHKTDYPHIMYTHQKTIAEWTSLIRAFEKTWGIKWVCKFSQNILGNKFSSNQIV